jgi:y4mF family transcriptional regulator
VSSAAIQTSVDIGRVVRARRKAIGLGQHELAELVGVSRQWVLGLERGKERADVTLVLRTLRVLGLQIVLTQLDQPARDNQLTARDIIKRARKP